MNFWPMKLLDVDMIIFRLCFHHLCNLFRWNFSV